MSYMFTLYKMQIVSTNHNSTNSKWYQYNQIGVALYISGLSTRVIYKRNCLQGSNPYYTLQLVRNFKALGSIQDNQIKKRGGKKRGKGKFEVMSQSHSNITICGTLACSHSLLYFKAESGRWTKWFKVTNGCHGTSYCSSMLLSVAASTSENYTLAMGLALGVKVPTTAS